jgi:two-component system response regulator NreC
MAVVKILICDDHAVVRAGLRLILQQSNQFEIVGEAVNAEELLTLAAQLRPDVIIMDLSLPGMSGLEAIRRLRHSVPKAKVLVLTIHDDEAYFFEALKAGAAGYVLKGASAEELLAALHLVIQGGVPIPRNLGQHLMTDYLERARSGTAPDYEQLSPRESVVVSLIANGYTNKEIASQLSVSVRTVERHRTSIMNKLGLQNRAQLVSYAVRRGILNSETQPEAT